MAVTYDGTTIRFYTNGVLDTYQAAVALHFGVVNESMTLGADFPGGDEYFKGTILDARVYGRALAASEINALINHPPVFTPVANQNTSAGVTLLVTNRATDLEVPPQILAFNLRNGPAGADVNPTTGVFSWRPRTSQADSTNAITVTVSDNGLPSLMATQTFFVTVGKSAPPTVSAPSLSNGFFQMSINGDLGPDYQIWTSTNLMNWQSLLQSNSPLLPFVWSDPNTTNYSSRFYRIMLSP